VEKSEEAAISHALAQDDAHGLTPELADKLVAAVARVPHVEQAAFACGVSPRLLRLWLRTGVRQRTEPFASFALRFFQAEALKLAADTEKIEKDLDEDRPKNALARLAYLKWRFGEHGTGGHTPNEILEKLYGEKED
jgi:hypothetical protein